LILYVKLLYVPDRTWLTNDTRSKLYNKKVKRPLWNIQEGRCVGIVKCERQTRSDKVEGIVLLVV